MFGCCQKMFHNIGPTDELDEGRVPRVPERSNTVAKSNSWSLVEVHDQGPMNGAGSNTT